MKKKTGVCGPMTVFLAVAGFVSLVGSALTFQSVSALRLMVAYSPQGADGVARLLYAAGTLELLLCVVCILLLLRGIHGQEAEGAGKKAVIPGDTLTGLYTEKQMRAALPECVYASRGEKSFFFVIFDVKSFKLINGLFGYETGDGFLRLIADQLREGKFPLYCRCEGDGFALLAECMDRDELENILHSLFDKLGKLPGFMYETRFNCAIVPIEKGRVDAQTLFDSGRLLRSSCKGKSMTEYVYYCDNTKERMIREQRLRAELDGALARGEFVVYLQPKFSLKTGCLMGAEALIRWNYRGETLLGPGAFVPLFEENGSIGKIDRFVLEEVCRFFRKWQQDGMPLLPISVNLSRMQLTNRHLSEDMAATVRNYGVPANLIDFELTESASSGGSTENLLRTMERLRHSGFRVSMDDFGTGYSSLSLLKEMQLDVLKLDRSFLSERGSGENSERSRRFVRDIIALAKHMNMTCLAEGVETEEQLELVREAGCDIVQGFYYSRPIPVEEYEQFLRQSVCVP